MADYPSSKSHLNLSASLRDRGINVVDEYEVDNGGLRPYRIDITIPEKKIAIEVDGDHHLTPEQKKHDANKRNFLTAKGWKVYTISASECWGEKLTKKTNYLSHVIREAEPVDREHEEGEQDSRPQRSITYEAESPKMSQLNEERRKIILDEHAAVRKNNDPWRGTVEPHGHGLRSYDNEQVKRIAQEQRRSHPYRYFFLYILLPGIIAIISLAMLPSAMGLIFLAAGIAWFCYGLHKYAYDIINI